MVTSTQGVFSSAISVASGCGSVTSPWSVKMAAGQKLSLTLIDYGWGQQLGDSRCRPLAYITENVKGINKTVCGGNERERHVYTSTTNHVVVQVAPSPLRTSEFLIRYHGKQFVLSLSQVLVRLTSLSISWRGSHNVS